MKTKFWTAVSLITVLTTPVYAGFQFTAPVVQQPHVSIAPIKGGLLPIVQDGSEAETMPAFPSAPVVNTPMAPVVQQQPQSIVNETPAAPATTNTGIMSLSPQIPVEQNTHEIAVGFGNDLPLVTALRQIIPAHYSYVLDKNIGVGDTVSWNGGREWPVVLDNTLSQVNLISTINGNVVTISAPYAVTAKKSAHVPEIIDNTQPQQAPISVLPKNQALVAKETPLRQQMISQPVIDMAAANNAAQKARSSMPQKISVVDATNKGVVELPQPQVMETQWMAQSGESLKTTLEAWSNIAGVDLFWSSDYDYPLSSDVSVSGEFQDAIEMLLAGFSQAQPKPIGRLHPNLPHGPAVLILETQQVTR
jgi:hypothetical protein